jgi:DNA-K related protein
MPTYASVHHVVAHAIVERWLDHLLREKWDELPAAAEAAVSLARMTGDRARDVGAGVRAEVEKKLVRLGGKEEWLRAVREVVTVADADRTLFFGEALPVGLRLVEESR